MTIIFYRFKFQLSIRHPIASLSEVSRGMGAFCLTMDSLNGGCFTTTTTTTPLDVIHADGMMVNDEDDIFVFMKYSLLSLFHLFFLSKIS